MIDTYELFPADVNEPSDLHLLLIELGWLPSGGVPGSYRAWVNPQHPDLEILSPDNRSAADYAYMTSRGLRALQSVHGDELVERTQAFLSLGVGGLDTTRWRKETNAAPGLIAWPQGEILSDAVRDQLVSAAKSSQDTRLYYGTSNATLARNFLKQCFLGQSDIGSYIMTAHTPRDAVSHSTATHTGRPTAQERSRVAYTGSEIMRTFDQAIVAVREALTEYRRAPKIEEFKQRVGFGVSYEMTSALARFVADGDCSIEMLRGQHRSEGTTKEVTFDAPEAAVLDEVARELLEAREPVRATVTGIVTSLNHELDATERVVRIFTDSLGPVHRLRIRVSAEQYDEAIRAHSDDLMVQVTGIVQRESRLSWMFDPDDFRAYQDDGQPDEPTLLDVVEGAEQSPESA